VEAQFLRRDVTSDGYHRGIGDSLGHGGQSLRVGAHAEDADVLLDKSEFLHRDPSSEIRIRARAAGSDFLSFQIVGVFDFFFGDEIKQQTRCRGRDQHGVHAAELGKHRRACAEGAEVSVLGRQRVDRDRAAAKKYHIDIEPVLPVQTRLAGNPEWRQVRTRRAEGQNRALELLRMNRESDRTKPQNDADAKGYPFHLYLPWPMNITLRYSAKFLSFEPRNT